MQREKGTAKDLAGLVQGWWDDISKPHRKAEVYLGLR